MKTNESKGELDIGSEGTWDSWMEINAEFSSENTHKTTMHRHPGSFCTGNTQKANTNLSPVF